MLVKSQPDGTFDLDELKAKIPIENDHLAQPKVISLENSHGGCNGAAIPLSFVQDVHKIASANNIRMHLDGARILNALLHTGDDIKTFSKPFNTISFCFSKGMGCPIGSVLLGTAEDMHFARSLRKMLGGGTRQTGILAACMQVSLEDWQEKLSTDNANCKYFGEQINSSIKGVSCDMKYVHTNMLNFTLDPEITKNKKKSLQHNELC